MTHLRVAFQASSPKLSNGWLSGWPFFCAFVMRLAALLKVRIHRALQTIRASREFDGQTLAKMEITR